MLDRRKKEERRMKKNEKLYFHGNGGFEQVDNKGRIEDKKKIAITSANKGLPCETVYFDESDGLELRMTHTERQNEIAFYTHAFCFSYLSIGDIAGKGEENDDISRYIGTVCFASAADVNKFAESRKEKIEPGWVEIGSKNETSGNKTVPNRNLVWKIINGVICDKKQVRLIVPTDYDLIATFRCSVIEILKHVPYGMWNRFSFSVNEANSEREVVFATGNSAKDGEYLIDASYEEASEPSSNFDWLIWKCVVEDGYREKFYNEFESGLSAEACIEDASYASYANAFRLTTYKNLWECFKILSNVLEENKENKAIAKSQCCEMRFIRELGMHKKNLGDVLTSPESDFSQCKNLQELDECIKKYSEFLLRLSMMKMSPNSELRIDTDAAECLIERATPLEDQSPDEIIKKTHKHHAKLGKGLEYLPALIPDSVIKKRMQELEAENGKASEKYLEDIKPELETALLGTSGSLTDSSADSEEIGESVGTGQGQTCTGPTRGKNSRLKRGKDGRSMAEPEPQDEKDTSDSHDAGDLNADRSRGESDSTATLEKLLEEMKECKEATIADDIQEKYSKNVREEIERIENRIETERFKKIVEIVERVKNLCCSDDIELLKADCKKREEADKQKESVLESMTSFKAFIEWYCEKGKQVNWRGECIDRLRKNIQENVCVDCSVKDLMHAAQFVSGKYDIYEEQYVYDAVKLIIENGLVSIKVNKNKTLDDIREELLYLRYLKPEEGDEYTIKCLTEGYLAGSSGKKNSTQEEKIKNQGPERWRKFKEKLPCRKETEFEIKLGVALDLIRKIEVSLNGDNERSGASDSGNASDETSSSFSSLSRKNVTSIWDECKDVQAKRDCIRMLKKCKLSEDKKNKLKRIENELKKEFEESESQYMDSKSSNIRLIIILALVVLILSFAGIYLYNYFFAEDEELIPTQPPATAQSTAESISEVSIPTQPPATTLPTEAELVEPPDRSVKELYNEWVRKQYTSAQGSAPTENTSR
jgi:hypothetical protein